MPVPEQLAEIAIFRTRHPDPRETIFQHQLQTEAVRLALIRHLVHALLPGNLGYLKRV